MVCAINLPFRTKATAVSVDNHVLPPEIVDHAAMLLERLNVMQRGRSDSTSGKRVRISRVRQRDVPPSTARVDRFQVADDTATVEQTDADGRQQQAQRDHETFNWNDGSNQSDDNGELDARGNDHVDALSQNGGVPHAPSSESAKCSCSQPQPQPSPQHQQTNVEQVRPERIFSRSFDC